MPRGRKKKDTTLTYDQRIQSIENEIADLQAQIKSKKSELKQLQKSKDKETIDEITKVIVKSGLSLDEVLARLEN